MREVTKAGLFIEWLLISVVVTCIHSFQRFRFVEYHDASAREFQPETEITIISFIFEIKKVLLLFFTKSSWVSDRFVGEDNPLSFRSVPGSL